MNRPTEDGSRRILTCITIGVILAQQYSINKDIKLFSDEGRKTVSKELQ
jgi:hypothetical protein